MTGYLDDMYVDDRILGWRVCGMTGCKDDMTNGWMDRCWWLTDIWQPKEKGLTLSFSNVRPTAYAYYCLCLLLPIYHCLFLVFNYPSFYLSIYLLCIYISIYQSICIYLSIFQYLNLSVSIDLSFHLWIYLYLFVFKSIFIHLSIPYLNLSVSIYLAI